MFNLKQVYANINFERSKIKLLIVEKTAQKINCLYYSEINQIYLDDDMHFINIGELHNKLIDLIKAADDFMGVNIKRYIVNISCLPLSIKFNVSPKFLVFDQILDWNHFNNYVNKIKKLNQSNSQQTLHVNPITWFLDDQEYKTFPISHSANQIYFQYYALNCNHHIIQQWYDLFDSLKVKIISFTNNSLGWSSLFKTSDEMNNVVVDIKSKNTIITIYKGSEVTGVENHPFGSNEIISNIKKILKINESINLSPILDNLKNLDYVNEQVTLINKYTENFLSITEATSSDLKKCLTMSIKKLLCDVADSINARELKIDKVRLNVNDELFSCISLINLNLLKLPLKFELLRNDIVGLEEKNVCNLLASINYVYELQKNGEFEFSIDDFVSQEISIAQTKQNILLKLGLISTRWAAKLEE